MGALGFPNFEGTTTGGRTSQQGLFHAFGSFFDGAVTKGLKVRQNSPLGMSVLVGGEEDTPDGVLLKDPTDYATYPVFNTENTPIVATIGTADSSNPRIDLIVAYVDLQEDGDDGLYDNTNAAGIATVQGTPSAEPSAPNQTAIYTEIGSGNPYTVLAEVLVAASATQIEDEDITDTRSLMTIPDTAITEGSISPEMLSIPGDYSTSEADTGAKWIDGKTIYKKTINFGALPNNSTKNVAHGISGLDQLVSMDGTFKESGGTRIPYSYATTVRLAWNISNINAVAITSSNLSSYSGYITLYYTKS